MKTFYIRGKITEWYEGMLIDATSEEEAIIMYEETLLSGNMDSTSSDLDTWNEMEEETEES
tara:strand:- start:349 stop:531 length:183 start_codon:yes stop_codon:yes gene_type:complete